MARVRNHKSRRPGVLRRAARGDTLQPSPRPLEVRALHQHPRPPLTARTPLLRRDAARRAGARWRALRTGGVATLRCRPGSRARRPVLCGDRHCGGCALHRRGDRGGCAGPACRCGLCRLRPCGGGAAEAAGARSLAARAGPWADTPFRDALRLSAVNSINWARIMAQAVYYFVAAVALGAPDRKVGFSVPTGNFGNVFAAHVARRMGLPIAELIIGTNRNDILARFINQGTMTIQGVEPSLSPSMDIQVSSNFERLLFELKGRSGAAVADAIAAFRATGTLPATDAEWQSARRLFDAHRVDDEATRATIAATWRSTGELIDPHSAVALAAAQAVRRNRAMPMVSLACAHPAKFPEAVESATGRRPALPPRLADLMSRPERITALPNDLRAVENHLRAHARGAARGGAA